MAESQIPLEFERPQGWRFAFAGVNLRDVPDALPFNKYASAKNIRATAQQSIQTRPGYVPFFSTGGNPVTDLKGYATTGLVTFTDRFLARDSNDNIWLDNGVQVASLTSGNTTFGATMLPFRPSESPQTWMYIAAGGDYQKVSAPDANTGLTTNYKVGIAEPSTALDAGVNAAPFTDFTGLAANWTPGGVLGALIDSNRVVDTAGTVLPDPSSDSRYSVSVTPIQTYQPGMTVIFNGTTKAIVQDVFSPVPTTTILAIRYNAGTTGKCTIVPSQMALASTDIGASDVLGALERGALVRLGGTEVVMVLNSTAGPQGAVCFECITVNTHAAGEQILGLTAIAVGGFTPVAGQSITGPIIVSNTTGAGIGTMSQPLATSPFNTQMGTSGLFPQDEDYIHVSLFVSDPTQLVEMKIIFNIDPTVNYQNNVYYYSVQPSLFAGVGAATLTQLQAEENVLTQSTLPPGTPLPQQSTQTGGWTEVMIPISSLQRLGADEAVSLTQCNGIQILWNTLSNILVYVGAIWVGGGYQPDIGESGAKYYYRAVPRNSITGVKGNATPPMRYGVTARRQQVKLTLPANTYDPTSGMETQQIDTWDIERYGGSVTSYRYVGNTPATGSPSTFYDNTDDAAALGGSAMETDNFEPWPSIDAPFRVSSSQATIAVVGTKLTISGFTGWPLTIARWLPGTLIQLGGLGAYTLRIRPTQLSATAYLFDLEECVTFSATPPSYVWILEPKVARQPQLFTFGPDAQGTFFAVGDHLRPGTVSFTKQFAPDSAPDRYNLDLCPPSEVLVAGFIRGGVALVCSLQRWWALYPTFNNPAARYNPIEQPVGRSDVAPLGHFTDGQTIWFWGPDGIYSTGGGEAQSLTDADLYNLFPHEGVPGVNVVRNGVTYYAPDYTRSGTFRLARCNNYIFADYQDTTGTPRTLVLDLRTGGWQQDIYNDPIICHYQAVEQAPPLVLLGDANGKVWKEQDCAGDNSNKISCLVAPFEWDGGDLRMQPLFGDSYLDLVPQSIVTAQPVSQGQNICAPTIIPASGSRQFVVVSVQGGELQKFLGTVYTWTE